MMALVEDKSLPHGPLELLMTVAEEVGLEGANGLDPALVTGSILVNLDSEEDGRLTVGCAGSTDTWIGSAPRKRRRTGAVTLSVTASGGLGGHSGSNIALGRSNAVKVLGRALREAYGRFRSASSRWTEARAATRSHATQPPSSRSRATRRRRSARLSSTRRRRSVTRSRRPTPA